MRKWSTTAIGVNVGVLGLSAVLAACGSGRSYDNPPEVAPLTVDLTSTTSTIAPTTTLAVFVPTTAPSTGPGTTRPTLPPPPEVTDPPTTTGAPPATIAERYTIVAGDGLFRISQKLGVPLDDLLRANGLDRNSLIVPGQELAIPAGGSAAPDAGATPAPPAATQPPADDGSGDGDGDGSGDGPAPEPTPSAAPAAPAATLAPVPGQVTPVETSASCQADDSAEASGAAITFSPGNVLDGNLSTAWRCAAATGQTITFNLGTSTRLTSVGLVGGYVKVDPTTGVDRFEQNRRVRQVSWVFDGGVTVTQDLADSRDLQSIAVDVNTSTVTLQILDTYPAGGEAPRDFIPVADVQLVSG